MELSKDVKAYLKLRKKLMVLEYAKRSGSVVKALKEFDVPKATLLQLEKDLRLRWRGGIAEKASNSVQPFKQNQGRCHRKSTSAS